MNSRLNSILAFDKLLLLAVVVLLAMGLFVIYTGSNFHAMELGRPSYFYVLKHLRVILFGFVILAFLTVLDHKIFHKLSHAMFLVCLVALVAVVVTGAVTKGAARWLSIGGMSLQPSELMKIAMFAYMSRRLTELGDEIKDFKRGYIQPLVTLGIVCGLILLQPNFSMALLVGATTYVLFFTAGVKVRYLLLSFVPIGLGALAIGLAAPYRLKRLQAWLHSEEHIKEGGYQLYNALISLGHGGWLGTGIGKGTQKLGFLPESYKDVAYSLMGEELGFFGTMIVLVLFGFIVYRGFMIARNANSRFAKYFAVCLTSSLAFNVIFHVFVCTGLMPTTGQPMPFISYGGTNLVVSMASIGILLNISRPGTGMNIVEPVFHEQG